MSKNDFSGLWFIDVVFCTMCAGAGGSLGLLETELSLLDFRTGAAREVLYRRD